MKSVEKAKPFFKRIPNNPSNKSLKFKTRSVPANQNKICVLPKSLPETDKIFVSKRIADNENYVTTKIASRPEPKESFSCELCKHNFNHRPFWAEHMRRAHSQNFAGTNFQYITLL